MKLEKINENQIRCTLTREDLEMHQVNLRELAYGSEKAKKLFRDMMVLQVFSCQCAAYLVVVDLFYLHVVTSYSE